MRVAIVGAGWAGASAARALFDAGVGVEVFEAETVVGGHSRVEVLEGVVYEPHGPHIFHTDCERVVRWVRRFGMRRRFDFQPRTRLVLDGEERLLSWPLRRDELRLLPHWPQIARELAARPGRPDPENFETWCISLLGETLYRWFVYGYTVKQWGCEPSALSSRFAPRRIDFRDDGDRRGLFLDRWQYFPRRGVNSVIEAMLQPVPVHLAARVTLADLELPDLAAFDHVVVTAPLDDFVGVSARRLAWRGVRVEARHHPTEELDGTRTEAYTINEPRLEVPYTRTVESKHATGQRIRGTVVCEEYPGADARHYPVHTPDRRHERENDHLKETIRRSASRPVSFCGRLANYRYLNQDEAILEGLLAADDLLLD